jgi:hypothetical protein
VTAPRRASKISCGGGLSSVCIRAAYTGTAQQTEQAAASAVSKRQSSELRKFEISPTGLNLIWSYDAGSQQRKIPELAVENLKKYGLWHKPEK